MLGDISKEKQTKRKLLKLQDYRSHRGITGTLIFSWCRWYILSYKILDSWFWFRSITSYCFGISLLIFSPYVRKAAAVVDATVTAYRIISMAPRGPDQVDRAQSRGSTGPEVRNVDDMSGWPWLSASKQPIPTLHMNAITTCTAYGLRQTSPSSARQAWIVISPSLRRMMSQTKDAEIG